MDRKARAIINRRNALKSTGPRTEAGKNASKYNALDHGLCSRRPIDIEGISDRAAYDAVKAMYENDYAP
ncbi:MAG: hypothetical protein ABI823_07520, partial [Bryobacteraceae bacterium]